MWQHISAVILLIIGALSQHTAHMDTLLRSSITTMDAIGSSQPTFPAPLTSSNPDYPLPIDDSITEAELLSREVENAEQRLERWSVASPAMGRVVEVQVMLPVDPAAPAPHVYLLGGADSPRVSNWVSEGWVHQAFATEQVTAIMPTQAFASYYSDWLADDPTVGRAQWETFLADELAPVMEAHTNFNGKRAIGGISMGAIGAIHLANSRPDVYHGAIGISGCYSTLDPMGRLNTHLQIGIRGGDVNNMWGEFGNDIWHQHDVVADPTGLRNTALYLYAASGTLGERDFAYYSERSLRNAVTDVFGERGAYNCTVALDRSLHEHGITHHRTVLDETGTHNWDVFGSQLQPAWEHLKPALS